MQIKGNVRMSAVHEILKDIEIPNMIAMTQEFPRPKIEEVRASVIQELRKPEICGRIASGMKIAIGVGSRGIANYQLIIKTIVDEIKEKGAVPYIVAAMGSHGGACEEGQREILSGYGITEENMGCPLKIGTDTKVIGETEEGLPVQIDAYAAEADGIVIVNRIKPHTAFTGPYESGLMKMLAIGLAKQPGADYCHSRGFGKMAQMVPKFGTAIIRFSNLLFGIGIVENSYDETCVLKAIPAEKIGEEEPELLKAAKANLSHILLPKADILVVHEIGKNISGDGMDPNVSGTFATPYASGGVDVQRVAVLNITEESHGNTIGWGMADMSTQKAFDRFDKDVTYPNTLTCRVTQVSKIPMIFDNDQLCIKAAIKTCADIDVKRPKIIYIKNTLHMSKIMISEALIDEAEKLENARLEGDCGPLEFDEMGNISRDYF